MEVLPPEKWCTGKAKAITVLYSTESDGIVPMMLQKYSGGMAISQHQVTV